MGGENSYNIFISNNYPKMRAGLTEEKLLVRLGGAAAEVLNELVARGYFNTKSEALRAGILRLAESYGLIRPASDYWKELGEEIRRSGKKLTHARIVEALKGLEQEA
jgi:Arc/MetJ-type ribon-helix-helix transcriptional regulator